MNGHKDQWPAIARFSGGEVRQEWSGGISEGAWSVLCRKGHVKSPAIVEAISTRGACKMRGIMKAIQKNLYNRV